MQTVNNMNEGIQKLVLDPVFAAIPSMGTSEFQGPLSGFTGQATGVSIPPGFSALPAMGELVAHLIQ